MNELNLVMQGNFNNVTCDFYSSGGEILMTRNQIGEALEYDNPSDSIEVIHRRHKDRLDKFSVTDKLTVTDGKLYKTYLYSQRGVMERNLDIRKMFDEIISSLLDKYQLLDLLPQKSKRRTIFDDESVVI